MATHVRYAIEEWGVGELVYEDGLLVWHELPRPGKAGTDGDDPLAQRLRRYFGGERVSFDDVPLDLEWCSPFQRDVLDAMRRIPYGETATYGEVAALAGRPNAQRAVGSFCAGNHFPILVPCHRVVAADGLGPYGSLGQGYKRRLLELEDAVL